MNYLPLFVGLTAFALLAQAVVMFGMLIVLRKTTLRLDVLAADVTGKILPVAETAHATLLELKPKIESIIDNVNDSSAVVRGQMQKLDSTLSELLDRSRLQVIRADEMVSRAMDRVEETTNTVQKTVSIPVRQFSGIMKGVSAGLEYLITKRKSEAPQDEMFI
jgi:methyl-accepting chemotaxis protein